MPPRSVSVHLLPELIPEGELEGGWAVVVDVLRATTSMVWALRSGASAIVPCGEIEEARRLASTFPKGQALLAGERNGVPIPGFDLGNTPESFDEATVGGKTVIMSTTNGTRAILLSRAAERVLIGSFLNLPRLLDELAGPEAAERPLHVVCSGTDRRVSWEDTLLAGAILEGLAARDPARAGGLWNDGALMARTLWWSVAGGSGIVPSHSELAEALRPGRGGRRLTELDKLDDLQVAAGRGGPIDLLPILEPKTDPPRIVPFQRRARRNSAPID